MDVKRLWFDQNPVTSTSRTGPDVKQRSGLDWAERVGAAIRKAVGKGTMPFQRDQHSANSARLYECPQCGESMTMKHQKRSMVIHIRKPENRECLNILSESGDLQQMQWARLAFESEYAENKCCPCCEQDLGTRGNMSRHMGKPDNVDCLQYAGKSGDPQLMKIFEALQLRGLRWLAHAVSHNSHVLNLQPNFYVISRPQRTWQA